jgi:hypothetical protein
MQPTLSLVANSCVDQHGNIVGSAFTPTDELGLVQTAGVLTAEQIMKKHKLDTKNFEKIKNQVQQTKLLDALFSWPDGMHYDVLLYLVAFCR